MRISIFLLTTGSSLIKLTVVMANQTRIVESKNDFIGRFLIGSGGTLENGASITEITLHVTAVNPFVSIAVHITPEEAVQIGKALMEHGARMQVKETV